MKNKVTPARITELSAGEVFVFGSNLRGMHGGGAARTAYEKFGAVWGQGVGMQGQSYAIPTMQGGVPTIKPYVDEFLAFARAHTELHFLVTRIGCGIAGFRDEEIAPLFHEALSMDNVSLPSSFLQILDPATCIAMPPYMRKKVHGQTATLVDMLIEMNKVRHFSSADEALRTLYEYLVHLRNDGDEVAFNCSVRSLNCFVYRCFVNGQLDIALLQQYLDHDYERGIDAVYKDYVVEKTITLIAMLNEFRRYTNPRDIVRDFVRATGGVNHCGPNPKNYYFAFGSPAFGIDGFSGELWGNHLMRFFDDYVRKFWAEFAPHGTLDNALFRDFMIERHARGVQKYGLEAVINRNYHFLCYAYFPYRGGAGPVYQDANRREVNGKRKFLKSCGEGAGPNAIPNYFEWLLIKDLLEDDDKYVNSFTKTVDSNSHSGDRSGCYYLPKEDYTLPVYHKDEGKVEFPSQKEKTKFIIEMKMVVADNLRINTFPPYLDPKKLEQELQALDDGDK